MRRLPRVVVSVFAVVVAASAVLADPPTSRWAYLNDAGVLEYGTTENGDRLPDFSHCGYMGGGVALPEVPVKIEIEPGDGDDGERIQAAIDAVGAMPMGDDGFRGAVLLKRGEYQINGTIKLSHSGVVLRGEGQDAEAGTVLIATGAVQRSLIEVAGEGKRKTDEEHATDVVDTYVPVGADSFEVKDTGGFAVGDTVIVHRPSTQAWIKAIGMDFLPPRYDGGTVNPWTPGDFDLYFDRVIVAIDSNRITLDAPLGNSLDSQYGGGRVYRYTYPGRVNNVGIESLRGESEFAGKPEDNDESHGWTMINIDKATNVWVRDVTSMYFGFGLADVRREAKWVTVASCTCLDPVSQITGSRRYPFNLGGQLVLFYKCYARNGRHDFAVDSRLPGPSAFVDCWADKSHLDSGPHHRWAAGILFDNVHIPEHSIRIQNRLSLGSGHGWTAANNVMWNCTVDHYMMHNPPTAQNWAIGVIGRLDKPYFATESGYKEHIAADYRAGHPEPNPAWRLNDPKDFGIIESPGEPVMPWSLYLEQLRCRLGEDAMKSLAILSEPLGQ